MTPEQARDSYQRLVCEDGEPVTLKRIDDDGNTVVEKTVQARVSGYKAEELIGSIMLGDSKVIIPADEVEASGFPVPFQRGGTDFVVLENGTEMNIENVDERTRRIAGCLIAYEIQARGA